LHAKTKLADWKTYLKWQLLNAAAPWLSQPFVEENFSFKGKHLQGRQEIKPRWKRCAENTDALLGEALGRKYVERYFPPVANGKLVLGEAIGELGGLKIAYLAFQKAQQQHPTPTLDGFTPDQQFFTAWEQFRGDATRPETQRMMVQGRPAPDREVPCDWTGVQLPALPAGVSMQGGKRDARAMEMVENIRLAPSP
jgi:predicted metalloendopeptidase